jgi:hypothetical protein
VDCGGPRRPSAGLCIRDRAGNDFLDFRSDDFRSDTASALPRTNPCGTTGGPGESITLSKKTFDGARDGRLAPAESLPKPGTATAPVADGSR